MLFAERKDLISVIIFIYNYKNPQNLRAVLKAIRNQNIDIEIVLSEQGLSKGSPYKQIAIEFNTKYVLSEPDYTDGKVMFPY